MARKRAIWLLKPWPPAESFSAVESRPRFFPSSPARRSCVPFWKKADCVLCWRASPCTSSLTTRPVCWVRPDVLPQGPALVFNYQIEQKQARARQEEQERAAALKQQEFQ